MSIEQDILNQLASEHNLRKLRTSYCDGKHISIENKRYINLSSNDYLGLGSDLDLQTEFLKSITFDKFLMSNPSSRLITGNSEDYDALEQSIEKLYPHFKALVFGSGYAANSSFLPAITNKDDLILADKLSHASIIDGLRLSDAKWIRFRHNDMEHLENLIKQHRGDYRRVWVVTESVFSMDGDVAPLVELVELKRRYDLHLYIDEAHGFGVFGSNGEGVSQELGVINNIDIIIITLGKALASSGAFVLCSKEMREMLINRARGLIFSTALPPLTLRWSRFLIDRLWSFGDRRAHLKELISLTNEMNKGQSSTQIIPIMTYDNLTTERMATQLKESGFWVTPIRTPTVPKGQSRIRLSLTSSLSKEDVERFLKTIRIKYP